MKGEKALAWSKEHDAKTEGELKADPLFQKLLDDAMAVLTAQDRIPYVTHRGGHLYNFWQDDVHVLGPVAAHGCRSTKTETPAWDVLLDLDKLSADEGQKWSFKGASCLAPEYTLPRPAFARRRRRGRDPRVRRQHQDLRGGRLPARHQQVDGRVDRRRHGAGRHRFRRGLIDHVRLSAHRQAVEARHADRRGEDRVRGQDRGHRRLADRLRHRRRRRADGDAGGRFLRRRKLSPSPRRFDQDAAAAALCGRCAASSNEVVFSLRQDWAAADGVTYRQGSLLAFTLADWQASGNLPPAIKTLFTPTERTAIDTVDFTSGKAFVSVLDNVRRADLRL